MTEVHLRARHARRPSPPARRRHAADTGADEDRLAMVVGVAALLLTVAALALVTFAGLV